MRRIFPLFLSALLFASAAVSANALIPTLSLIPSNIRGSGYYDESNTMRVGFGIGGQFEWLLQDRVSMLTGLMYETRGGVNSRSTGTPPFPDNTTTATNLGYIQVPAIFTYRIIPFTSLFAGPELSFLVSAENDVERTYIRPSDGHSITDTHTDNIKSTINAFDLGLVLGANYLIMNKIVVTAALDMGLMNIRNNIPVGYDGSQHNYAFKIGVGYRFDLK